MRGNRIKNIVDELAGERIDIVRWSDDLQVLIPNALQPAEVEEVILCQMLGRAIVLVREDQLSLAIGRRGQNVRLASKLCGWDIEIMTREELDESIERAVVGFSALEGVDESLSERLVGEGFLSYDDLSIIEPDALMEMGELTEEQADADRRAGRGQGPGGRSRPRRSSAAGSGNRIGSTRPPRPPKRPKRPSAKRRRDRAEPKRRTAAENVHEVPRPKPDTRRRRRGPMRPRGRGSPEDVGHDAASRPTDEASASTGRPGP